jgi:hypothetical protein
MNWFLWPGDKVCDLLGLTDPDDRQGFRTFANMIIWGAVIVGAALVMGRYVAF